MIFTAWCKCLLTLLDTLNNCLNLTNAELCYFLAACGAKPLLLEDPCAVHRIIWLSKYICIYLFHVEGFIYLFIVVSILEQLSFHKGSLPDDYAYCTLSSGCVY